MTRRIPDAAVALVKRFEGLSLKPYRCPAGYLTVCWGHVLTENRGPAGIETCERYLRDDLALAGAAVCRLVPRALVDLSDGQYGALVSFTFNLGPGALQSSTLRRKINAGADDEAAEEFPRWVFAGGRKLAGLELRRAAERAMFLEDRAAA